MIAKVVSRGPTRPGDSGKLYHTKCTGDAQAMAEAHTIDASFTLFLPIRAERLSRV
jgi:hypothetical protein